MTDTNYLDVGCSTCGHVPQSEKHLCDTTPETEWEKVSEDKWHQTWRHKEHGERIINTELLNYILESRDTYWKEQLQKAREESVREYIVNVLSQFHRNEFEGKKFDFYFVLRTDLDKLKVADHSELDQDITSTTWNPDIEGMKRVGKEWNELDKELTSTTKEG